jgi:HEAT repeat protein
MRELRRYGIIRQMKSAREVVEDALREEPDSHERWDHVVTLHERGDDESFVVAAELLDSPNPDRRALGADILAQLGAAPGVPVEDRPLAGPAFRLLLERIATETHPDVLQAIATAFGHLSDPRGIPALHALRDHSDEDVRHAVVFGLLGQDDDLAVETLVELSRDPDPDVRDWAIFGLGMQIARDDPQIRDALVARLDDPDDDARGEALRGLAVRGDERAIPQLLIELESQSDLDDPSMVEEALLAFAARMADPRLRPYVEKARQEWAEACPDDPMPDYLSAAVEAYEQTSPG